MNKLNRTTLLVAVPILLILVLLSIPQLRRYLLTQLAVDITLERTLTLKVPDNATPGDYSFQIDIEDQEGGVLLARSEPLTVTVEDDSSSGAGNNDSGSGDGDDSSRGGGGGGEEPPDVGPVRTYAFAPERGHKVTGQYSGVTSDKHREVVKLASDKATLEKVVRVPQDRYWLYIDSRDDRPGPVKVAVYVNDKAWKIVTLDKQDDNYRVYRTGLLRQFPGARITFRMVEDVYDKKEPTNEAKDRNTFIDSWALSTDPNLKSISVAKPNSDLSGSNLKTGINLLPRLNQYIREELGPQHVNPDIWYYYARRLVASPEKRESIKNEEHLRVVMRFWRAINSNNPKGQL